MSESDIYDAIKSSLSSASLPAPTVKSLRTHVLVQLQLPADDKGCRKLYKAAVKRMEGEALVELTEEGGIEWKGAEKKRKADKKEKKDKKDKKEKKAKKETDTVAVETLGESDAAPPCPSISLTAPGAAPAPAPGTPLPLASPADPDKNKPCGGNRDGVTRLFLGNLPFKVDEASLASHLPAPFTHVKWITDKDTGRFYGSAFVEMRNSRDAAEAVGVAGSELMGRKIKINFAAAREGDIWPPAKSSMTGGQAGGGGKRAMSEKPEDCQKLFIGNLSYDIDDDGIFKFFGAVDAEVKAVRWLHHKENGDFKGVGYVEFWSTEACDKAATLNGKNLLGRPIRIDWTE
ncbi:hypothetical protein TeGR_g7018 [Tetraparma gracilis]|uniref:RRM domain-containing protein n=1 Tax=Tetraparma gracilis TaxID=2962635 RepID=A0ABQ6NA81_9STRA|nr:hypothetical protein TeGR_g7018 [Tetraparma gracilis]